MLYTPKTKGFFITGTDTGVGKTLVACGVLSLLSQHGYSTAGIKPVSCGCDDTHEGMRNDDAVMLSKASSLDLPYNATNPLAFKQPVSPHIAANNSGQSIHVESLANTCKDVLSYEPNYVIVEGAGGWRVPVNDKQDMSDLAQLLGLPVILTVGMRLGCLNHTLLSAEVMARDGMNIAGWVANVISPDMDVLDENIETLKMRLPFPHLGTVPFLAKPSGTSVGRFLSEDHLLT